METFNPAAFLAQMAKPVPRAILEKRGELVNCTQAASWVGFVCPAYLTAGAWDALVGQRHRRIMARSESRDQAERLRFLWRAIAAEMARYKAKGITAQAIVFKHARADAKGLLQVEVRTLQEARDLYLVVKLTGE